jgi:parallel beta-helix repeat protein
MQKKFIPFILILVILVSILLFSLYSNSWPGGSKIFPSKKNSTKSDSIPVSASISISKPGFYRLTTDISQPASGHCAYFGFYTSNVIFDGMGHTIDGGTGIPRCTSLGGFSLRDTEGDKASYYNITIRNVTLSNMTQGVSIHSVQGFYLENVTIMNVNDGLRFVTSSHVVIKNNSFINNSKTAIFGRDNEKVTIDSNRIVLVSSGIQLDGRQWVQMIPPQKDIFGIITIKSSLDIVNSSMTVKRSTSADRYIISNNSVQNVSHNGISLTLIDDFIVRGNTITNCGDSGIVYDDYGPKNILENNTFTGNRRDIFPHPTSGKRYYFPPETFFGIVLLLLFAAIPNIAGKIRDNKILNWIWTIFLRFENYIQSWIQKKHLSLLFESLIGVSIIGLVIFGTAYALKKLPEFNPVSFGILLFISGIVTIAPRLVQNCVATRKKVVTEYRLWWGGIIVIMITSLLPLEFFGQPVKMVIRNEASSDNRHIFLTKIVAPLTTILLSIVFYILYVNEIPFALNGMQMSALTSVVMLLPISPMEGVTIWKKKILWIVLFFPALAFYLMSLLLQYTFFSL